MEWRTTTEAGEDYAGSSCDFGGFFDFLGGLEEDAQKKKTKQDV